MSLNICKMCKRALRNLKECTVENCLQGLNPLILEKEIEIKISWWQKIINRFK